MAQTWQDLLSAHWRISGDELRRVVPPELPLDTFRGAGWIGITAFVLRGLRLPLTVPVPGQSSFPEVNVRTYVVVDGRPGVYFLSLDAASSLAVHGARLTFRLPYFRATMSSARRGGEIVYSSQREASEGEPPALRTRYRPCGRVFTAERGSLEYFLTERYCLYTVDGRHRVHRADIHHPPWPMQAAEAHFDHNTMTAPLGIELAGRPLLHFAGRQDVLIWPRRRL